MSFENKLPRGYRWEGFLGGSFHNTLNLAQIVASRKSVYYHTKIIKIKTKDYYGKPTVVYGVAMKMKNKW